jgi:UPF0716 family protein affecting phage T7 exclusion
VLPGLLSDLAAALLLAPPIRRGVLRRIFRIASIDPFEATSYGKDSFRGEVRDAEFEVVEDKPPRAAPSGKDGQPLP